jgi:hypothetical protein
MRKKLTEKEKIEIYTKAIEYIHCKDSFRIHHYNGFCYSLKNATCDVINKWYDIYEFSTLKFYSPEIAKHKPKDYAGKNGWYWWECDSQGTAKRIAILKEAIAELQAQILIKKETE